MSKGSIAIPPARNEAILPYRPASPERRAIMSAIKELKAETADIPMIIGGKEVRTARLQEMRPPHEHHHVLARYHEGDADHVRQAIEAALSAKESWEAMAWEHRAAIFLKAADLIAGPYRARVNAVTMLGQSKNVYQAEIDAACELIDFLRFNVEFASQIYAGQPYSPDGMWNRLEYRPLEGFVFAVPPFNFSSIAANLAIAPAMMGNVIVWKPSPQTNYACSLYMEILHEAGLPDGVINMVFSDGPVTSEVCLNHPDLAGLHFTGSLATFQLLWQTIGQNIHKYKTFPRIVGETGGKDFVVAHHSAEAKAVATALTRGAFEYQGQKCSAASRAYIPSNLWDDVRSYLLADLESLAMGSVEDFGNFVNAVIDERAFDKIAGYIDRVKADGMEILFGGNYDKSQGYFVEPTVVLATDPGYLTMCEEIFGPVLTIYVYDENQFDETLALVDSTSPYALTGSIFARDRSAVEHATHRLRNSAGNFYINDKPTAAVVGQQPFGGARASGTNDKAGSMLNLLRWVSPRTIKETFVSPTEYRYPFLEPEN